MKLLKKENPTYLQRGSELFQIFPFEVFVLLTSEFVKDRNCLARSYSKTQMSAFQYACEANINGKVLQNEMFNINQGFNYSLAIQNIAVGYDLPIIFGRCV